MKILEMPDGTVVSEIDVSFMDLKEISNLLAQIQSEVFRVAKERRRIATMPKNKKDFRTLKNYNKYAIQLMNLQEAQCWIGKIRKAKRDVMQKQRDWYKKFYELSKDSIKKKDFEKIVEQTSTSVSYKLESVVNV